MHIPEIVYLYKGYNDHCVATEMMWGGGRGGGGGRGCQKGDMVAIC